MGLLKIITLISLLVSQVVLADSSPAQLSSNKYLGYCSHFGDGVSFSFSSCVNSNFSRIARSVGRGMRHCFNSSQGVSFSFTSCINSNFRTVEAASNGRVYLRYCSNFDRDRLDFGYISCINSNFSSISRTISL